MFNWQTETWTRGNDMAAARWYPSVAQTANGEEVIIGGGPATADVRQLGPYPAGYTLNTAGNGVITATAPRDSINRDYGSFATYDVGRADGAHQQRRRSRPARSGATGRRSRARTAALLSAIVSRGTQHPDHGPANHHGPASDELRRRGILHADHRPDHIEASPEVLYSLRYRDQPTGF